MAAREFGLPQAIVNTAGEIIAENHVYAVGICESLSDVKTFIILSSQLHVFFDSIGLPTVC